MLFHCTGGHFENNFIVTFDKVTFGSITIPCNGTSIAFCGSFDTETLLQNFSFSILEFNNSTQGINHICIE